MGYEENVAFNNAEAITKYSSIYQYDPLGRVGDGGYPSTNAWGANIFTATNKETLRAVGFYATDIDVNYNIYIYGNVTTNSPTNGTLLLSQTGASTYSGYHTVALSAPVDLLSGQLFSVVIKFINSSYTKPVAREYVRAGYSSRATCSPGQSYVSPDGISWSDLATGHPAANVCIKAYAVRTFVPVIGDFDNDGLADPAVVDADGYWTIWWSTGNYTPGRFTNPMYVAGGTPVAADFDNDGLADPAMVDADGYWHIWWSSWDYNPTHSGGPTLVAGGIPLAADFDNDGLADPAMVDADGYWHIWWSSWDYNPTHSGGPTYMAGGIPLAGDFDADGLADPTMVGVDSYWTMWMSNSGYAPVRSSAPFIP